MDALCSALPTWPISTLCFRWSPKSKRNGADSMFSSTTQRCGARRRLDDISAADWHRTLAIILDGAFFCTQAALRLLRKSEQPTIVNIGGMTGHTGAANRLHVVTAKAGLAGMTRALAHELAPDGITVNCVAPGMIDTVRHAASSAANPDHRRRHHTLLARHGTAGEVAQTVAWLAGDGARFVTGQVIHVFGSCANGRVAYRRERQVCHRSSNPR